MKAPTYRGSKDVRVETLDDPRLVAAHDPMRGVAATAICASDPHRCHGKVPQARHGGLIISHRIELADAAEGYKRLDGKQDDCRKAVLTP